MDISEEHLKNKLRDINAIDFGDDIKEVSASLMIVVTMFEADDQAEVIKACRNKLFEGINKLKQIGADDEASKYEQKIKP